MIAQFLAAHSWYDIALFLFTALVMPAMSVVAGKQLARGEGASLVPRYWFTIARGALAAAAVLAMWCWSGRSFALLGLDWPIGARGQFGFVVVAVIAVVGYLQIARVNRIPRDKLGKALKAVERIKITPRDKAELSLFMLVSVDAGIWEELVYRGFLVWFLLPLTGLVGAAIASSFLFGIGHAYQGWRGMLMTGFVGLILAVLYVLTASLWWVMAVHAAIDISGGLVTYRLSRRAAEIHQTGTAVG
ncbi:MAG TPA: CPBP family intramembrane glutamic endopeptidase [Rhizomicrobium sp.]|jgi:membrane protease YdiL (CAAX protease family)